MSDDPISPGQRTFAEVSSAIMSEEAGGYIFVDSKIPEGADYNRLTFDHYADGPSPPGCVMQRAGDPPPGNHRKQWTGKMLVEGNECDVALYRATA